MQNKIFGTFYEKNNNQMFIAGGGAQMAYSNNYGFGQFQLFDSREQKNKSFIFSLGNKLKIFFSDDEDSYKKPDFLINYNSNRLFYGNEYISPINGFGNTTPIITANYSTKTMQTTYTNNQMSTSNGAFRPGNYETNQYANPNQCGPAPVQIKEVSQSNKSNYSIPLSTQSHTLNKNMVQQNTGQNLQVAYNQTINMNYPSINTNNPNNISDCSFVLSGMETFLISNFEIYEISF